MATVSKWTPFGVALDITATAGTVTRKSATQYTVVINASWETYYSGAKTNYGMSASSGGVTKVLNASGTSSAGSSGSFTGTYTISGNGSATKTITVTFKNFNSDNSDSATKTVSFNVTVPAWTSYTVSYNANGGTGEPSNQTKWKDQDLTLSSTTPTRTGYTFKGWATSANGSVAYAAGASYTGNAALTLYAVWQAITYTVKFDANGGTGAPANQTKTYGVNLTLSSTKPTRTNYKFLGWGTSASGSVAYASGASYTTNAAVTLYAVWELAYTPPTITDLSVTRCDSDGTPDDFGESIKVSFNWSCDQNLGANEISSIKIRYKETSSSEYTEESVSVSGTSGTVSHVISGGGGDTLTWDGDTTDKYIYFTFVKVSDVYVDAEVCTDGFILTVLDASGEVTINCTPDNVSENVQTQIVPDELGNEVKQTIFLGTYVMSVSENVYSATGEVMVEKGTYFINRGENDRTVSLTINGYTGFGGGSGISLETSYDVQIVATDSESGTTTLNSVVAGANFPIDILAGGTGVSIGKPATVDNALDVYKQTIIRGNEDASGTTASGQLIVGDPNGYHLAFDNNEMMAKQDATTPGNITINYEGGNVGLGGEGSTVIVKGEKMSVLSPLHIGENTYMLNGKSFFGFNSNSEERIMMQLNASDQAVFGYGGYANNEGASYFDGNSVNIRSKGAIAITSPTAGLTARHYGVNKVLWSGGYGMSGGQSITLSEAISAQPHGVILVFSWYSESLARNWNFTYFFVPKHHVAVHPGVGAQFGGLNPSGSHFIKYLYINDTTISGYADNWTNGTKGGVALAQTNYVLRYVIGV